MSSNRVVVYKGPGEVEVESIDYPRLEVPREVADHFGITQKAPHAAILKVTTTNICGSDQHMVRGRTTAPVGQTLGHEITGEVVETGEDVLFVREGDICSVPFNIACGRCRMCEEGKTGICLNVNPARAGAAYGYVDMGGWIGGQAEYVMVPYADFNLLKFPDRDQALEKILDLTMLSDIFPTGYHGAYTAGVTTGSTVYVAGAGPVGLAAAHSAQLLGASVVMVGDMNADRLRQAESFGCVGIDLTTDGTLEEKIAEVIGEPEVDAAVDAVASRPADMGPTPVRLLHCAQRLHGRGPRRSRHRDSRTVCDRRPGGGGRRRQGRYLGVRLGLGWAKSHRFMTGQCPVKQYNRKLMNLILHDKAQIAKAVSATTISLDEAPQGYQQFDSGVAQKFVIDPHGMTAV